MSGRERRAPGVVGGTGKSVALAVVCGVVLVSVVTGFERLSGARFGGLWALAAVCAGVAVWIGVWSMRLCSQALSGGVSEHLVRLPVRLAWLHGGSWALGSLLLGAGFLFLSRYQAEIAFLVVMAGCLTGMGAFLVALLATPLVLGARWGEAVRGIRQEGAGWGRYWQSLRRRMTLVLGSLVFFACGFALYSSFAMQREIVAFYARSQGEEVAAKVEDGVLDRPGELCRLMEGLVPAGGALAWVSTETGGGVCSVGVEVDAEGVAAVSRGTGSRMTDSQRDLEGAVFRLDGGVLTVFVPRPDWTKRVMAVLSVFFTLLFLFSAWLAGLASKSMTAGVLSLRAQVGRMEAGDLQTPFVAESPDELGELATSMERMRHGVSEMVETIRSLNLTLEEKVKQRTEQLEQANGELTVTLERLKAAQAQLVHSEKMASLGRLLAGLAHELRNPINAIVNNAEPLKEKLCGLEASQVLDARTVQRLAKGAEVIEHAGKRTVELLTSLSSLSRPDAAERKQVVLKAVVESAMKVMGHRFEGMGVSASLELEESAWVWGHAGELGQLVVNLLDNAIDAAASGGRPGEVKVVVRREGEWAELSVWDNGSGVAAEDLPRLFEPFFTRKANGTGLGLAIVHQVVTRHAGSVEVVATQGRTGFVVRLPAG